MEFTKKSPCNNCPYRKDAPLKHWHKDEYKRLLSTENELLGTVYGCHKNDGNVCVGWLMKQDENRFPSIALRMELSRKQITREYLDALSCKSPLYKNVKEMVKANYPELLKQ